MTDVLLNPNDEILMEREYAVAIETDLAERQTRRADKRRVLGRWISAVSVTMALAGGIVAENYDTIDRTLLHLQDDGDILGETPGCKIAPLKPISLRSPGSTSDIPEVVVNKDFFQTLVAEQAFIDEESGATRPSIDIPEMLDQYVFGRHEHKITETVSPSTGITFDVYSDADHGFSFDPVAFEEFLVSVIPSEYPTHGLIDQWVKCMHTRLFVDKEFEGMKISMFIPSNPRMCFRSGTMREVPHGDVPDDFCDTRGATPAMIDVSVVGHSLADSERWVFLLPSMNDGENPNRELSEIAKHEFRGHFLQVLDARRPMRLDRDEALAKMLEQYKTPDQATLPAFITYD